MKYAVLTLALAGLFACSGGTPTDACQNMVDQCGDSSLKDGSVDQCAEEFQKLLDDGDIEQKDIDCYADAGDCEENGKCTTAMAGALIDRAVQDALSEVSDTTK